MKTSHTPGPWRYELGVVVADLPRNECKTTAIAYVGDEWRHVNGLCYGGERDANARLIAAAPDLLAALEACFDEMARGMGMSDRFDQICYNARAAIAKAKE